MQYQKSTTCIDVISFDEGNIATSNKAKRFHIWRLVFIFFRNVMFRPTFDVLDDHQLHLLALLPVENIDLPVHVICFELYKGIYMQATKVKDKVNATGQAHTVPIFYAWVLQRPRQWAFHLFLRPSIL